MASAENCSCEASGTKTKNKSSAYISKIKKYSQILFPVLILVLLVWSIFRRPSINNNNNLNQSTDLKQHCVCNYGNQTNINDNFNRIKPAIWTLISLAFINFLLFLVFGWMIFRRRLKLPNFINVQKGNPDNERSVSVNTESAINHRSRQNRLKYYTAESHVSSDSTRKSSPKSSSNEKNPRKSKSKTSSKSRDLRKYTQMREHLRDQLKKNLQSEMRKLQDEFKIEESRIQSLFKK